jgi:hypothetical protein
LETDPAFIEIKGKLDSAWTVYIEKTYGIYKEKFSMN